jgi:WD40 repeat protein
MLNTKRVMIGGIIVLLLGMTGVLALTRPTTPTATTPLTPIATPVPLQLAEMIEQVAALGRGWINDLAWSPVGDTLAVAASSGIWLYDAGDLNATPRFLTGHTAPVSSIDFSADGRTLVSGSWDKTIRLWDVGQGAQQAILEGHTGQVEAVAFSADDRSIISGGFDLRVRIWDVETGREQSALSGHDNIITAIAVSPDNRYIVSGSRQSANQLILWDAASGEQLQILQGRSVYEIETLAYSPDGTLLAATTTDGRLRLWDTDLYTPREPLTGNQDIAFQPTGSLIAVGGAALTLHDLTAETEETALQDTDSLITNIAFGPDGARIAAVDAAGDLRIWDVANHTEIARLTGWHSGGVNAVAFSPDSATLVTGGGDTFGHLGGVHLWNVREGVQLATLPVEHGAVQSMAVSPDGRTIAVGTTNGVLEFRDGTSGQTSSSIEGHQGRILSVVFSPDGTAVASGGDDAAARLWDVMSGQQRAALTDLGGPIRHLNLSEDGSLLPSEGVQDITELAGLDKFSVACTAGGADGVTSMLFSPDKKVVASAYWDNIVKLVDLSTGEETVTLRGHTGNIWSLAFSPDSRVIATASADRTVRLWDATTGQQLALLEGHTWDVNSVSFSPDARLLASGSADGTVRLWQVSA